MNKNLYSWTIGLLLIVIIGEALFFYISTTKYFKKLEVVRIEIHNKELRHKIFLANISKKLQLQKHLENTDSFLKFIHKINSVHEGRALYLVLPENACLDCIKNHFTIINKIMQKKENLSLTILCRPVHYRKYQIYKCSNPKVEIESINESIPIRSEIPFLFSLDGNRIDNLFFINKNFENYTETFINAICDIKF